MFRNDRKDLRRVCSASIRISTVEVTADQIFILLYIDIFVNYNWVDTRWQQFSTHLHTNNTENNTINWGRVQAVPRL
jgi:hypothetical protein